MRFSISDCRYAKYLRSEIEYHPNGISKNSTAMNRSAGGTSDLIAPECRIAIEVV